MTGLIDEEVVALQSRIFASQLDLGKVLNAAGVHRSTWSRWRRGASPNRATLRKISGAIEAKLAEVP